MLYNFDNIPFSNDKNKKNIPVRFDGNIDVDIVLGMPSKNCQFHGICKINPSSNLDHDEFMNSDSYLKNSLKAVLRMDTDGNLIINFDRNTITTFIENKYLGEELFVISESIMVPEFVSSTFGIPFEIKMGSYKIEKIKGYYQIKIEA